MTITSAQRCLGDERGQSTVDLLLMMFVLTLITFGLLQLALLMTARQYTNYAASATARAAMVEGFLRGRQGRAAARDVMRRFSWPDGTYDLPVSGRRGTRSGVVVPFYLPLGSLLYPDQRDRGIRIEGFAMTAIQPGIPEEGDNAGR